MHILLYAISFVLANDDMSNADDNDIIKLTSAKSGDNMSSLDEFEDDADTLTS